VKNRRRRGKKKMRRVSEKRWSAMRKMRCEVEEEEESY
jgi:hypothetical protein